jgi:single-strand DNA-binding protein
MFPGLNGDFSQKRPKYGWPPSTAAVHRGAMFEITGTVKKIFDEQTFGSGFNKREFVLTIESGKFPQDIKFECVKDKVALVAALKPGAKAKVFFDLRGREWKENYYVNLNAWKIEAVGAAAAAPADEEEGPLPEEPGQPVDEDVPF